MNSYSVPPIPFAPRLRPGPAEVRGESRFPVTPTLTLLRTTCDLSAEDARRLAQTRPLFASTDGRPASAVVRGSTRRGAPQSLPPEEPFSLRFEAVMVGLTVAVLMIAGVLIAVG